MQSMIEFDNVSKRYLIGAGGRSLRNALAGLTGRLMGRERAPVQQLWAVQDVSFNVHEGESVGILGHNGAGKTTALKLLAGITQPTKGSIRVGGRLGSLIELGAGFHPEMTGRENVYLNGVILGMTRKEVARQFDSIVEFAGIGAFIDTPVKRYSSGMYVRLAFAVAAHTDPRVLLVDEVLAVGDIAFRAKCYRRMAELRTNGTTVVLVSHDVHAIRDTCDRALLLWQGRLLQDGEPDAVISAYLARMQGVCTEPVAHAPNAPGSDRRSAFVAPQSTKAKIRQVIFRDGQGCPTTSVVSGQPLTVEVRFSIQEPVCQPIFRIDFYREGRLYTGFSTAYDQETLRPLTCDGQLGLLVPNLYMPCGVYSVSLVIADRYEYNLLDVHHHAYSVHVMRAPHSRGEVPLSHTWQRLDAEAASQDDAQ